MKFYRFSKETVDGNASMKELLGGKGANLAEMASLGLPIPPGFTIPTTYCNEYRVAPDKAAYMAKLAPAVQSYLNGLDTHFGYMPLLSVRSGARVSMPGMMDTVLNVGLHDGNINAWADSLGATTALDSYRRLLQMYGSVVCGIDHDYFEKQLATVKKKYGVTLDSELSETALGHLISQYQYVYDVTKKELPKTQFGQVMGAIEAVFKSWDNPRAKAYRQMNGYPDDWGTAVNIQSMVFGNMNDQSATGVLFTRNPSTGENKLYGEYLINAQGEDVVAGIRTPHEISTMEAWGTHILSELEGCALKLENHYRDMQDIEFTIQNGELFILQCRSGKRSAKAAFRIAREMMEEGLISAEESIRRVSAKQYMALKQPKVVTTNLPEVKGIAAGGGCVVGQVAFSEADVKALAPNGPVILVAHETTPDDIVAMNLSQGILTQTGGMTSHAAVVARGMDKTCVVGCTDMNVEARLMGKRTFSLGDWITIDGQTGNVWLGKQEVVEGEGDQYAQELLMHLNDGLVVRGTGIPDFLIGDDYCLDMGSWVNTVPETEWAVLLSAVRAKVPGTLYVDLHTVYDSMSQEDHLILNMVGAATSSLLVPLRGKQVAKLVASGVKCSVIAPAGSVSITSLKAGQTLYKGAETYEAVTVKDLLNGAVPSSHFINYVLGGEETHTLLMQALEGAGVKIPEPGKPKVFATEAALAFQTFSG